MLRAGLQDLYNLPSRRLSLLAKDSSDVQFIANHLVDMSIAMLSPSLLSPILDVGCGNRPYDSYFTQPGGRALISVPMWWPAHELPYDFYRYPEHGLRYLAESAGFRVLKLVPRGGIYALIGQIVLLGFSRYLPARILRSFWNLFFLKLDAKRLNPSMTLGWTILVEK